MCAEKGEGNASAHRLRASCKLLTNVDLYSEQARVAGSLALSLCGRQETKATNIVIKMTGHSVDYALHEVDAGMIVRIRLGSNALQLERQA